MVYGSEARVVLNPTSGEDRATILNAIYSLQTEGATNAEAGLRLGYQLASQALPPRRASTASSCAPTAWPTWARPARMRSWNRSAATPTGGITLTTVGFGMGNFNDVLMEQLADNGDGNYAYVDNLDEAQRLFVDNLTSTLQVIALDAKVQVDFNPDMVARYRLIGYENRAVADQDFRNDTVDAGEIGAGHTVTALYAVQLRPGAQGRIATVQLRWEDPDTPSGHRDQRQLQHLGPGPLLRQRLPALPVGRDRSPVRRTAAPQPVGARHDLLATAQPRRAAVGATARRSRRGRVRFADLPRQPDQRELSQQK